jgi:hypothetical protein
MPGSLEMHREFGADMNPPQLHLVVDRGDGALETAFDLPQKLTTLAIHLHMGGPTTASMPAAIIPAPAAKSRARPFWLGFAGIVATLVVFETGAHLGAGHAQDMQTEQAAGQRTASMDGTLPLPASAAGELPAALQQQLRQPPIVTPPPGAAAREDAPNPFGLQP